MGTIQRIREIENIIRIVDNGLRTSIVDSVVIVSIVTTVDSIEIDSNAIVVNLEIVEICVHSYFTIEVEGWRDGLNHRRI